MDRMDRLVHRSPTIHPRFSRSNRMANIRNRICTSVGTLDPFDAVVLVLLLVWFGSLFDARSCRVGLQKNEEREADTCTCVRGAFEEWVV